jgi:hypothetical protein
LKKFHYRFLPQKKEYGTPINIAFIDKKDIQESKLTIEEAVNIVAEDVKGPAGINVFDMDAVTTTSDGIVVKGAIIAMAAADNGKIHPEFGMLYMEEIQVDEELLSFEPHLKPIHQYYPGCKLYRGPNPEKKLIPVHNAVITGKAINNNSATEMMNAITMEEILLPILGQLQIMKDGEIILGYTGEVISVGIGMTVAEKFGRVFPTRQFKAGETAHNSGEHAKNLKAKIPCIVAPKSVLAREIIRALNAGLVPGLHLGCSPAVLKAAYALNRPIAVDNITKAAKQELASVGIDVEELRDNPNPVTEEEVIMTADEIIPGVENGKLISSSEIVEKRFVL